MCLSVIGYSYSKRASLVSGTKRHGRQKKMELTALFLFVCLIDVLVGMATQLAPLYLTEIAPYNLRGMFGTANQLFITIGIFMGSVFGLREILGKILFVVGIQLQYSTRAPAGIVREAFALTWKRCEVFSCMH